MINIVEFLAKKHQGVELPKVGDELINGSDYTIDSINNDDDTFYIVLNNEHDKEHKIEYQFLKDEKTARYLLNDIDPIGDISDLHNIGYHKDKYLTGEEIEMLHKITNANV